LDFSVFYGGIFYSVSSFWCEPCIFENESERIIPLEIKTLPGIFQPLIRTFQKKPVEP
jgi:hypothetical protein